MNRVSPLVVLAILFFASCGDEVLVKPAAQLRLDYPEPVYRETQSDCPYTFDKNEAASLSLDDNCNINVIYPAMRATVYLTYIPIEDNKLEGLLSDAQKLTYDHTIKANEILEQPRVDPEAKVYGMYYMINGDAATQSQFYVTDSLNHFLTGSLYFDAKPNFDSIYPAVVYLREDIRKIMETIRWE
ncbi:gliding motility lipoprotein GldD [Aureitalea marina]|uniref:Gliding motility lipoprotein GldD n=1 Tax=Aureitalea marina TaxID=930804 RepID=A0A2S7KSS9_9FLAO|nr:gliding motility lipoprotein GldD [Aureitalea marina]PQB05682.1 gliding motility lipoprotein GldD [Aureitalea marina]